MLFFWILCFGGEYSLDFSWCRGSGLELSSANYLRKEVGGRWIGRERYCCKMDDGGRMSFFWALHNVLVVWRRNSIPTIAKSNRIPIVNLTVFKGDEDTSFNGRVMKSCSSILGSRDFKSILRILPFCRSIYFAMALSTSKHPTSNTFRPFNFSLSLDCLSHWTRTLEESPPLSGSWPLDEACW